MAVKRVTLKIKTDSFGDFTGYAAAFGELLAIGYEYGTLANTVDVSFSDPATDQALIPQMVNLAQSNWQKTVSTTLGDSAGTEITLASTDKVHVPVPVAGIKVVVAQGGNAKTGYLHFLVRV